MVRLRSIHVLSCAKVFAVIHGAIGVLVALFLLVFGIIGIAVTPSQPKFALVGFLVLAALSPFIYAALGFVMGALWAFLYNLTSQHLGGLEFVLETVAAPTFGVAPPEGA